jgi:hypothetical protein
MLHLFFFGIEDGGDIFLLKFGRPSMDFTRYIPENRSS